MSFTAYEDLLSNFDAERAVDPASYSATKEGEIIEFSGGPVLLAVLIGAVATATAENLFTMIMTQATSSGGDYAAADSAQYRAGDSWDRLINATGEANAVKIVQFIPKATYTHGKVVFTMTGTAEAIFGVVVLQGGRTYPQTT